ncbi:MAG: low specificity L-threonine aldolase [Bauldia sp.]
MNFASDNWAGVAPEIVDAIAAEAARVAPSYGSDDLTKSLEARFAEVFEHDVAVFLVATGTAANALALSAVAKPAGLVFCHAEAHINSDEAGAPEFLGDVKLIGLEGPAGKVVPEALAAGLQRYAANSNRHGQPVALSLSQLTELGAAYSAPGIAALSDLAHRAGIVVHMDGARFANAIDATGLTPAEMTWKAGVDLLSFGATKNGCLAAEAVVFFDRARAAEFAYLRKRAGHVVSKTRFIAAQFDAYFRDDLWLRLAAQSNGMASRLGDGIVDAGGRIAWPTDGNEVFAIIPRAGADRLKAAGANFYEWEPTRLPREMEPTGDEVFIRLVASFTTTEQEVDRFVGILGEDRR